MPISTKNRERSDWPYPRLYVISYNDFIKLLPKLLDTTEHGGHAGHFDLQFN